MTQQLETEGPPVPLPRFERHEVAAAPPASPRAGRAVPVVVVLLLVLVLGAAVGAVVGGVLRLPVGPAPAAPAAAAAGDPADPALAVTGRSQLLVAYGELSSAGQTFSDALAAHGGDVAAQQRDFAAHRVDVQRFRTAVAGTAFAPADGQRVTTELLPAADRVVADLDTMATTPSSRTLVARAGEFDRHSTELDGVVRSVIGG